MIRSSNFLDSRFGFGSNAREWLLRATPRFASWLGIFNPPAVRARVPRRGYGSSLQRKDSFSFLSISAKAYGNIRPKLFFMVAWDWRRIGSSSYT